MLEQLISIAKGGYTTLVIEKRKFGNIVFAAVSLPVTDIQHLLDNASIKLLSYIYLSSLLGN